MSRPYTSERVTWTMAGFQSSSLTHLFLESWSRRDPLETLFCSPKSRQSFLTVCKVLTIFNRVEIGSVEPGWHLVYSLKYSLDGQVRILWCVVKQYFGCGAYTLQDKILYFSIDVSTTPCAAQSLGGQSVNHMPDPIIPCPGALERKLRWCYNHE